MADVLPPAVVVHAMKGRTRLRVADRRGDESFFASVAAGLSALAGVRKVEVAPLTGGILVFHDAPLSRLGEAAEKGGLFSLTSETTERSGSEDPVLHLSPRMVAAAALGLVAAWQIYKEQVLPPALTLAWYAATLAGLLPTGDMSNAED